MSWQSEWVAHYLKRELTEFQHQAVTLLCEMKRCGPYDFAGTFRRADWEHGHGVSFVVWGYFATFDCDGLTRLVVGAHDRCIRVEVKGCGPGLLRVSMWPRKGREGRLHERHPTLEQAAALIRPEPTQHDQASTTGIDIVAEVLALADKREEGYARRASGTIVNALAADGVVALAQRIRESHAANGGKAGA